MKDILEDLPSIYKNFFPSFFQLRMPEENLATCSNCPMLCAEDNKQANFQKLTFSVDSKCCTYYPDIPNYLVGAILSDPDPLMGEGKKRIRERIRHGRGVSPLGVYAPKLYMLKYTNRTNSSFGNTKDLICPFYEKKIGGCTVWKHRSSVCSSWYCKTTTGKAGKAFYNTLLSYLNFAQTALAKYALLQNKIPDVRFLVDAYDTTKPHYTKNISAEELDNLPVSEQENRNLWKAWHGKEEQYFIKCYEEISKLSEDQFSAIAGIDQQAWLEELKINREKMIKIPAKLKRNERLLLKKSTEGNYRINLTTEVEVLNVPFDLPSFIIDAFDGMKTLDEINKELKETQDIELDDEIVLTLYQHGILVEAR